MTNSIYIDDVLADWRKDAVIDESKISYELIRLPMLHSKYLEYYIHFKHRLSKAEMAKSKMGWVKRKYFRGECEQKELEKYQWSQWQGLKPGSSELNQLLEFDADMSALTVIVTDLKTAVTGCEYIMGQLKGREFSLKAIIDYQRFLSGS